MQQIWALVLFLSFLHLPFLWTMEPIAPGACSLEEEKDSLDEHSSIIPFQQEYAPHGGKDEPPKLLRLFDDDSLRPSGSHSTEISQNILSTEKRRNSKDEISQRAAKKSRVDLNSSLGLPILDSNPASLVGSSSSKSPMWHLSISNTPTQNHPVEITHTLNLSSPSRILSSPSHNRPEATSSNFDAESRREEIHNVIHESTTLNNMAQDEIWINLKTDNLAFGREFESENLGFKFWAWLSIVAIISEDKLADRLKKQNILPICRMGYYVPRSTLSDDKKNTIEGFNHEIHLQARLQELMCFIWDFNHQILKLFGISPANTQYTTAQISVQKEFHVFISKCKRYYKHYQKGYVPDNPEFKGISNVLDMYQQVSEALHATSDMHAYKIYQEGITKKPLFVSKPQMMRNFVSFNFVRDYYKTSNVFQWENAFTNGKTFIAQIMKSGSDHNDHTDLSPSLSSYYSPEMSSATNNILNNEMGDVEDYVKPIFPGEVEKFIFKRNFECKVVNQKTWAWISRVQFHSVNKGHKLFQPISSATIDQIRGFLAIIAEKNGSAHMQKIQETPDEEISRVFGKIFDLAWTWNNYLLEIFGAEINGEDYVNEQRLVQLYYLHFLSELSRKEPVESHVVGGNTSEFTNKSQSKSILELTSLLFISEDRKEEKVEANRTGKNTPQISVFLQEDIDIAKIVTYLLGHYYKNQNIEKWYFAFGDDLGFLVHLTNKSTSVFHHHSGRNKRGKAYDKFQAHPMIPWKARIPSLITPLSHKLGYKGMIDFEKYVKVHSHKK